MDTLTNQVEELDYSLCSNEHCNVAYYNLERNIVFNTDQIKVPIWYKNGATPKYICYCNKVTEEQIIDAVVKQDAKDIKDVIKLTGAMKNGKCEINNPTGRCCGAVVQDTISKVRQQ